MRNLWNWVGSCSFTVFQDPSLSGTRVPMNVITESTHSPIKSMMTVPAFKTKLISKIFIANWMYDFAEQFFYYKILSISVSSCRIFFVFIFVYVTWWLNYCRMSVFCRVCGDWFGSTSSFHTFYLKCGVFYIFCRSNKEVPYFSKYNYFFEY